MLPTLLLLLLCKSFLSYGENTTTIPNNNGLCPNTCTLCTSDDIQGFNETQTSANLIEGCAVYGGKVEENHYIENHMIRIKNTQEQTIYLTLKEAKNDNSDQTLSNIVKKDYKFILASQKPIRWILFYDTESINVTYQFKVISHGLSTVEIHATGEMLPEAREPRDEFYLKYGKVQFRKVVAKNVFNTYEIATFMTMKEVDVVELIIGRLNFTEQRCAVLSKVPGRIPTPNPSLYRAITRKPVARSLSCSSAFNSLLIYVVEAADQSRKASVQVELDGINRLGTNITVVLILHSNQPTHWLVTSDIRRIISFPLQIQTTQHSTVDTSDLTFTHESDKEEIIFSSAEGNKILDYVSEQYKAPIRSYVKFTHQIDFVQIRLRPSDQTQPASNPAFSSIPIHPVSTFDILRFVDSLKRICTSLTMVILIKRTELKRLQISVSDLTFGDGSCKMTEVHQRYFKLSTDVPRGCGLQRCGFNQLELEMKMRFGNKPVSFPLRCRTPVWDVTSAIYEDISSSSKPLSMPIKISPNNMRFIAKVNLKPTSDVIPDLSFNLNKCFLESPTTTLLLVDDNCQQNDSSSFLPPYNEGKMNQQMFSVSFEKFPKPDKDIKVNLTCILSKCAWKHGIETYALPQCHQHHQQGIRCSGRKNNESSKNLFTKTINIGQFLLRSRDDSELRENDRVAILFLVVLFLIALALGIILIIATMFIVRARCHPKTKNVKKETSRNVVRQPGSAESIGYSASTTLNEPPIHQPDLTNRHDDCCFMRPIPADIDTNCLIVNTMLEIFEKKLREIDRADGDKRRSISESGIPEESDSGIPTEFDSSSLISAASETVLFSTSAKETEIKETILC